MSQNPHKEYRLELIEDLATIPLDHIEACLRDLQYAVELFHLAVGENPHGAKLGAVVWKDDGDHSIDMTMNGEPCLKLTVTGVEGDD